MTSPGRATRGNIIVGVDGSPSSELAVIWAATEARLQHRGLTLVHARKVVSANELAWLSAAGIPPRQIYDHIWGDAEQIVDRAHSLAAERCPDASIERVIDTGDPRNVLLELGSTASMTVVGTRGHGRVAGLLLGSVSGVLVRHAEGPLVVVRHAPGSAEGILVASDGSDESKPVVEHAYREASWRQVPLTVVHCLWDGLIATSRWITLSTTDPAGESARLRVAETLAGMAEKFPEVEANIQVTRGAIDACLVDLSARHELLVIGRPSRPRLVRLTLSGLTTPVVEHAHSPVLVVP
ncbi:MAG TPA: universal stress protein [Nocardioides sp.]|uniref:universal stress protein n=1 Tax=Nocardioides sp. TaxID=35761 RepID=UPI002F3E3118